MRKRFLAIPAALVTVLATAMAAPALTPRAYVPEPVDFEIAGPALARASGAAISKSTGSGT